MLKALLGSESVDSTEDSGGGGGGATGGVGGTGGFVSNSISSNLCTVCSGVGVVECAACQLPADKCCSSNSTGSRKSRKSFCSRGTMSHSASSSMRGGSCSNSIRSGSSGGNFGSIGNSIGIGFYDETNGCGSSSSSSSQRCNTVTVDFTKRIVGNQWTKMLECAEFVGAKRSKHTVVAYKDAMYVFGGDNGKSMLNDLIRFGVKDKSWGRACATGTPPAPRYHHSAVVNGSSMFIFGGYTGNIHSNSNLMNKNDLFEYKFKSAMWVEWKVSPPLPSARSAHTASVYDNKMWIYAGYDGNVRLNDMWVLNLTGENHQWENVDQKGEVPPTCCNFPAVVARDCMYVFSGQSGQQITNFLYEFHFATKTWRRIYHECVLRGPTAEPPSRRFGHTMVHHDRFLYVFGGSGDNMLPNDLHCFDLDTNIWSVITPAANSDIPSGRVFHASAVIGDAMYVFGGTVDNSVRRGDTYRFKFSDCPKCTLSDDFGKFFREKQFCDIQFIVGPEEVMIPAHIAFIAARCEYLREQILEARNAHKQQMERVFGAGVNMRSLGNTGRDCLPMLEVRLPNTSPEAFEGILNYIYTDHIDLDKPTGSNVIILLADIYQLARRFSLPRLALGCIQYLEFKIDKQNVLDALNDADQKEIKIIRDKCLQFILKDDNYKEVVFSKEFIDLDKPLIVEIIRSRIQSPTWGSDTNFVDSIGATLENDMAAFLDSTGEEFCDIDLILDGKVIPAHKSVLTARCSYFQAMFRSFMPPDNTVNIQIGEISPSPEAFQSLLRYIYYAETKVPPQDAVYLFEAPSFYGLSNNRLAVFCKYSLENNITHENVLQTLEATDITKIYDIKEYALFMIVKEFTKVARLPKMGTLSRELLLEIIHAVADAQSDFLTRISINTDI